MDVISHVALGVIIIQSIQIISNITYVLLIRFFLFTKACTLFHPFYSPSSRFSDTELRLSFHLLDGLPGGRLDAGLPSLATFASLLFDIRETCSLHNLLLVRIHFTMSSVWNSFLISMLSVFPLIAISTLISLVGAIFFVSTVSAHVSDVYVITGLTRALYILNLVVVVMCLFFHTVFFNVLAILAAVFM